MILVDTNVIIDVLTRDPKWFGWSADRLADLGDGARLFINEITYAELAVGIAVETGLKAGLSELSIRLERAPDAALFATGRAFSRYRAAGGPRVSVLPDFFIGAHAAILGCPVLTRDPRRYRSYFPGVELIAPET